MLNFNTEFQNGTSKITQVRLSVLLQSGTLLSLTEENILLGGFTRDTSTTVDGAFTVGAAVTGKLTVQIDNSTRDYSGYDFRGAVITADLGGELSDETYQLVRVGIYTVDEYTYDGANITLTAYDNFYLFDEPCSDTTVTFPITIKNIVQRACDVCGVTLGMNLSDIPNGNYSITKQPEQWETMTWHDVIAYCAQIGCTFARILPDGRLFFSWYDTGALSGMQYDGGTFDTSTTPYSDGAILSGGDFTYSDTGVYDGGHFGDRANTHILSQTYSLTVDTDDVLITGVKVILDASDNINADDDTEDYETYLGTTDYMITIEGNPLIETTANANSVCTYLYNYLVGMRFRPLNVSLLEDPSLEAGDVALIVDRDNNTYACFLSHVTYTTGAATTISCDAESTMQNLKARYSQAQKTRALTKRTFNKAITDAESAMSTIMTALATTMGLYQYTETQADGSTIYIYGNKNTLAASNIRWKFSAGAMMVSDDYGATWNGAVTADGLAVLQEIYAVKVNADNIVAGTITGRAISGATVTGTTITGGTISGTTVSGATVTGGTVSGATVTGGSISGTNITGGTITSTGDAYGTVEISGGSVSSSYSNSYAAIGGGHVYIANILNNTFQEQSAFDAERMYFYNSEGTGGIFYYKSSYEGTNSGYPVMYLTSTLGQIKIGSFREWSWPSEGSMTYANYTGVFAGTLYSRYFTVLPGGSKNKLADTEYGMRELYCYETPSPMYGDVGSAVIGDDGTVVIEIDPIFDACIAKNTEYYVFLQNEGQGESYVSEKHQTYFIVSGTPGLRIVWEMKGRQYDLPNIRSEVHTSEIEKDIDYEENAFNYVMDYLNTEVTA